MSEVIQFPTKEIEPDPGCVQVEFRDGKAVKWFRFTCSFESEGEQFCFDLWARDAEDAQKRMVDLKATARVDGQVFAYGPA